MVAQYHDNAPHRPAAGTAQHAALLARLARLTGARGGAALWAIVCCIIVEGSGAVQWSRRELRMRTGFSEDAIDKGLALGEAAGIIARRPGVRPPGQGGVTPIVLALCDDGACGRSATGQAHHVPVPVDDTPCAGVLPVGHAPRRGVSTARRTPATHPVQRRCSAASEADSTRDSRSYPEEVESTSEVTDLIDRLAARASAATGDTAPRLMREQVDRVVKHLVADDWLPGAMMALVDEAVSRAEQYRAANRAAYCRTTLERLVAEGWRPAHGMTRRPALASSPDAASCRELGLGGTPAAGEDDHGPGAPEAEDARASDMLSPLAAVSTASGLRLGVPHLWQAVLDQAARGGAGASVAQWRLCPFVAVSDREFWLDPPPGSHTMLRRLRPYLTDALSHCLGRPAMLQIGRPGSRRG